MTAGFVWEERAQRYGALPGDAFRERWMALPTPAQRTEALRLRQRHQRGEFLRRWFPQRITDAWSPVHRDLLSRPKVAWDQRPRRELRATAAPRDSAKSTVMSFGERIHDVCYGLEKFIVLISTTFPLSQDLVKDLYGVFTDAEAWSDLHEHFGPFTVTGTQTDFVVSCPGSPKGGTRILAASFGGTIRGIKHDGIRPTLIVIDDGEHPDHVRSPDQRKKTWEFLTKDILKAGRRGTRVEVAGTVLHPDSMLARLLVRDGWTAVRYRAVISWPKRMDLWECAKAIWKQRENPKREEDAFAYYEANRAQMDDGAEVLWPEHESLWELMVLLWSDGAAAFWSEKQNEPRDPEGSVFDVERFRLVRFDGVAIHMAEWTSPDGKTVPGRKVMLKDCEYARWLDPSLGKAKSDYPALATVVRERGTGYEFVLRCSMDKGPPSSQRARVWSEFEMEPRGKWGTDMTGLGALFDEGFEREKDERKRAEKPWELSMAGFKLTEDQVARISSMQPDCENGFLQFAHDLPAIVFEQFRDHPTGAHNDGPDAIERARWLLRHDKIPTVTSIARGYR